jgi:hypothetical protein
VNAVHVRAAARALHNIFGRRRRRRAKGGNHRLHDEFMGGADGRWNFRGGLVHRPTLTGVQENKQENRRRMKQENRRTNEQENRKMKQEDKNKFL